MSMIAHNKAAGVAAGCLILACLAYIFFWELPAWTASARSGPAAAARTPTHRFYGFCEKCGKAAGVDLASVTDFPRECPTCRTKTLGFGWFCMKCGKPFAGDPPGAGGRLSPPCPICGETDPVVDFEEVIYSRTDAAKGIPGLEPATGSR